MGGRACLDRHRAHHVYYRASILGGDPCAVPRWKNKGEGTDRGNEEDIWHRKRVTQNHN
jgi:hypothetical protein